MRYGYNLSMSDAAADAAYDVGSIAAVTYVWVRADDGRLCTVQHDGIAAGAAWDALTDRLDAYGYTTLAVVEAERDLSTGEASAWVAHGDYITL